jgi:hypothetical protein
MKLLGEWNWYLPAALDRRLPRWSVEDRVPGPELEPVPAVLVPVVRGEDELDDELEREPVLA